MGNMCCICKQMDEDEAANALLNSLDNQYAVNSSSSSRPRGPPPPYQAEAPFYAMTDEQRAQWVQRVTMIQCLPLGRYDTGAEKKEKELKLEPSDEVQGMEKKGEKDRECPICMMDFTTGEPIRLLPCMHFYHMRCIDNWLMRSYYCPTCMERVDVGMRETITTSATSHHPTLRRRRRRRRGERGSTSSTLSGASLGSVHAAAERCSKERDNDSREFLVPEVYVEGSTASAGGIVNEGDGDSSHRFEYTSEQLCQERHQGNTVDQACQHNVSAAAAISGTGQLTMSTGQDEHIMPVQGLHEGTSHMDMEYVSHNSSSPQEHPPFNLDQIIRISNFEVDPQGPGPFSPPLSPSSPHPVPLSPPMFEYHFEFPLGRQTNHSSQ